jgi:O-antigen ligase
MNKQMLRGAVLIGLFIIPFVPFLVSSSLFFPFITTKAFVWRILVEVIFAAWVLLALLEPTVRPKKSPILYAVGIFLVVVGAADLFGMDVAQSFWSNFERMEGYITLLHLGAFALVIGSVFGEENWRRWWNTSIFASFLMVLYCLMQLAGLKTINQGGVRVDGTFGNAIYLAVYLLFHIFLMLFYMVREKGNKGLRWLYGGLIALELFILYSTATRGSILGLIGGLLIFALLNIRNRESAWVRKSSIGVIVALVVIVGGFFAVRNTAFVTESPVLSRFASLSLSEVKSQGRYYVWPMAWQGFKERPVLGWGQENFPYVFQKHYRPEMYSLEPWFDRAHNIFLDWLVSAGFLGLIAYLSLYGTLLYMLWQGSAFTHLERTVLTALTAAYFFHNIFVFDNLGSYILFFSLLAYAHGRKSATWSVTKVEEETVTYVALPIVIATLLLTLYFVNIKPLKENTTLIQAFTAVQIKDMPAAAAAFEKAYTESPYLGRAELAEQIASNAVSILSSNFTTEEKNKYYLFARDAIMAYADESAGEARPQIVAGSFLSSVGKFEESLERLTKAQALMPNKQAIYFEEGSIYISQGEYAKALATFKHAYDLAPQYQEAKIIYLIGAIYARDTTLEARLVTEIPQNAYLFDDRLLSAYYAAGRTAQARLILERRKERDPQNAATYDSYLNQLENN